MKRVLLALAATAVLGACATPAGYYEPFQESRIAADRVRITYTGQRGEPPQRVEDMALLRAADVAAQGGFTWFLVDNRFVERSRDYGLGGNGPHVSIGGSNVSFGRSSASSVGVGVGFNLGNLFGGGNSYGGRATSTIEVLMGRGAAPVGAYDVADVQRTIRGRTGYQPAYR